jgi:ABC-2 type transport system ATP-binding protein
MPLELRAVVKSWRGLPVLRGVDLTLEPGKIAWLGGRNGAGKTTLLRIATNLLQPESGVVRLSGLDPTRSRREFQSRLGYLPAGNGSLYARLSVTHNLDFWGGMALLRGRARTAAVEGALERFELAELRDRRVDRLSMGQRQRVRLASIFLHSPHVVLLDEPHTSLDDEGLALLRGSLDEVVRRGGGALWCSPSKFGDELGCDAGWVLEDGQIRPA